MKNTKLHKLFITFILSFILASCRTETSTIDSTFEYKDFLREESHLVEVDSSIASHLVNVTKAETNPSWNNSNFSLKNIPQNLHAKINLDKPNINNYKISGSSETESNRNPVIYKNKLFTLADNFVFAYKADNPKILEWKAELSEEKNNLIGGGIYIENNNLAVTYGGKEIFLINANNGNKIWSHNLANIARSSPLIYRNSVFINTIDNTLHCLDLKTGFLKWAMKEAHEKLGFLGASSPVPFEDTIIIPFSSGKLSAIDINTGQIKWAANLSMGITTQSYVNDIDMAPVIKDGVVYISSHNGILYAIQAADGTLEWANQQIGGHNQIWISGDYVYTINNNNQLLAIFRTTGTIKWIYNLEKIEKKNKENIFFDEKHIKFEGPTMINGNLYVISSDGKILIISAKLGEKIKDIKISRGSYSPAIVVDEKIYLLSSSGTLSVIS